MMPAGRASDRRTGGAAQVAHLDERLVERGRRAGSGYRDGYEKFVGHVIAVQQKLAKQSKNHAVKSIVETPAGLTLQVTSAYTSAARKLIP